MKGKITLTPPNKEGKIPVTRGDRIWWIDGTPHRVEVKFVSKENRMKTS